MKHAEIWIVSLDPESGHERKNRRPVISPDAFNRITKLPAVVPITSGGHFSRTVGFAVSLAGVGIKTAGVIRCNQRRSLDLAARAGLKFESIPEARPRRGACEGIADI
jgi:mRNA interferase ChpB